MKRKKDFIIVLAILPFMLLYAVFMIYVAKDNQSSNNKIKNTTNQTTSNSINTNKTQKTTKTEDSKSKIKISLSREDKHKAGSTEIKVYVDNNSSKNIKYIKVNLFEKSDGKIIQSKWTNDSSLIKAGASQTIDTYFDFRKSTSTLEAELDEVTFE